MSTKTGRRNREEFKAEGVRLLWELLNIAIGGKLHSQIVDFMMVQFFKPHHVSHYSIDPYATRYGLLRKWPGT